MADSRSVPHGVVHVSSERTTSPLDPADALARRTVIENVPPQIDRGRFAIARTPGEAVDVTAGVFADGYDELVMMLSDRSARDGTAAPWRETPMTLVAPSTDEWSASFTVDAVGSHEYAIVLGFDVVYLPPIHPIGRSFRTRANNALTARAGDPGSEWAIGSEAGGHTAVARLDPGVRQGHILALER
jgi:hypothetical protein